MGGSGSAELIGVLNAMYLGYGLFNIMIAPNVAVAA